jgi:hypothetical protein
MMVADTAAELERTVRSGENPRDAITAVEHALAEARAVIANLLDSR